MEREREGERPEFVCKLIWCLYTLLHLHDVNPRRQHLCALLSITLNKCVSLTTFLSYLCQEIIPLLLSVLLK